MRVRTILDKIRYSLQLLQGQRKMSIFLNRLLQNKGAHYKQMSTKLDKLQYLLENFLMSMERHKDVSFY